ncbi:MAG: hypothetical protein ACRC5A_06635 [Enterobacteriaceae bacterium]
MIQVLNAERQPVGEPVVSCLHITLPLGSYIVQFTLGEQSKEYEVVLEQSNSNHNVRDNSLWQPVSVIPDEDEISAAEQRLFTLTQYSETLPSAQQRGQLVLVVHQSGGQAPYCHQEIRLQHRDGSVISSFLPITENKETPLFIYEWCGEAGTYLLSLPGSNHQVKSLPVTLCCGWQTQLFLHADEHHTIDLQDAALAMTRLGKAFQAGDHILTLTESLRILLHKTLNRPLQIAQEGFWSHFCNPTVGLLSAWLLLQSPDKNRALLTKMVIRLKQLAGWIPDIRALAWAILMDESSQPPLKGWRKELAALPPLDNPPTLLRSGIALLEAEQHFKQVITPALQDELFPVAHQAPQGIWLINERME